MTSECTPSSPAGEPVATRRDIVAAGLSRGACVLFQEQGGAAGIHPPAGVTARQSAVSHRGGSACDPAAESVSAARAGRARTNDQAAGDCLSPAAASLVHMLGSPSCL